MSSRPESVLAKDFDYEGISERLVGTLRRNIDSDKGGMRVVRDAIAQVPGLENVLFPKMDDAGLSRMIPKQQQAEPQMA